MIVELLILALYFGIIVFFYRFHLIIKAMIQVENIIDDLTSDSAPEDVNKREFLAEKLKKGESISNSKTHWTEKRLQEVSDKMIDKLHEKYQQNPPPQKINKHQNPPPQKINKHEALQLGTPYCTVMIDLYAEGLKSIVDKLPYIGGRYTVNVDRLKSSISANTAFCDNIAIKIGTKMMEKMWVNTLLQMGISVVSMTWDAIVPVQNQNEESGPPPEIKYE
jgi:hypothetical protein